MRVEIDQSGKVEQTEKDTVLCLSNDHWDAVTIKARTKRQIQENFRRSGQTRNFIIFTFSAALAILIRRNLKSGKIIIDREYFGKEPVINELLLEMLHSAKNIPDIYFYEIGKESQAHAIAHDIATKEIKTKKIVSFEEIFREIKRTEVGKRLKNA